MAIPKYPALLTSSDWNRKKGLLVRQYKTGVSEDMVVAERDYKRVGWDIFDANKALKDSRGAAEAVQNAYMAADLEYKTKVTSLINVVSRLSKRAAEAKKLYTAKKAPASSIAQAGKVETAANQFVVQLKLVHAELEQFKLIANNPTVEAVVGSEFFLQLGNVKFPPAQVIKTFFQTSKKLKAGDDLGQMPDWQQLPAFQREFEVFKRAIAQLLALRYRRLETKVAKTQVIKVWEDGSGAYHNMFRSYNASAFVNQKICTERTVRWLDGKVNELRHS